MKERSLSFAALFFAALGVSGCGGNVDSTGSGDEKLLAATTVAVAPADADRLSSGANHVISLGTDGTVWGWGKNDAGQLGADPSLAFTPTPVAVVGMSAVTNVPGLSGVVAVKGGAGHTVALTSSGNVWVWGSNTLYQLGNQTMSQTSVPLAVAGLSNVKAISAGLGSTVALKKDGTVWAWGLIGHSQTAAPAPATGLVNVVAISAGGENIAAVKNDGSVWTWGDNYYGELGTGSTAYESTKPVMVPGLNAVKSIAVGTNYMLALKANGTVWAWGDNARGQLGIPTTTKKASRPVAVLGLSNVKAISAGILTSAALHNDGTVSVWGDNTFGQFGNGTYLSSYIPSKVPGVANAVAVSLSNNAMFILTSSGMVYSMGLGWWGELGNNTYGSAGYAPLPVPVVGVNAYGFLNLGQSTGH